MAKTEMTKREMLVEVAEGRLSEDVMAKAAELLEAMDAEALKRKEKADEKRVEKLEAEKVLEDGIYEVLDMTEPKTASELKELVEGITSPQKATIVAKRLVTAGLAEQVDVKKDGRKVKGYIKVQ